VYEIPDSFLRAVRTLPGPEIVLQTSNGLHHLVYFPKGTKESDMKEIIKK
jgi:hypothetical protein